MTKKPRAALYARVSTDRQREKHTIDSQLRLLPEYAQRNGWEIIRTYIDDGKSGETIEERPAFRQLLEDASQGIFDVVLAVDEDRLCRSRSDFTGAVIYDAFRTNNIKIATISGTLVDLSNEDHDLYASMLRSFSKWEKQKILSRTRRGRQERWRKGIPGWGKPPYGYEFDRETKSFRIHEEHASVVRWSFEMCVNGFGLDRIAEELTSKSIPPPSVADETRHRRKQIGWAKSTVAKILAHEGYCGNMPYNRLLKNRQTGGKVKRTNVRPPGDWISVAVPQIITPEIFNAAQKAKKQRKVLADRNKIREYLCGGLLHCCECGSKLCGEPSHGRTYYVCYNRRHRGQEHPCTMRWISSRVLDSAVWSKIEAVLRKPEILTEAIAHAVAQKTTDPLPSAEHLERLLEMKDVEAYRARRLYTKGKVNEAELDQMLRSIEDERTVIARNLALVKERQQFADKVQSIRLSLQEYRRRLRNLSFSEKRKILRIFVDGSPGTGIFVSRDAVKIVGIIPVESRKTAQQGKPTTWMLHSKLKQA